MAVDQLGSSFYILTIFPDATGKPYVQWNGPFDEGNSVAICNMLVTFPQITTLARSNGYCSVAPNNIQVYRGLVNGKGP